MASRSAHAAPPNTFTWRAGAPGTWSDASKWSNELSSGAGPAAGGQADYRLVFNQAGTYTVTNDLDAGFVLNTLTFSNAALTLAGNAVALSSNGAIEQNGATGVTISMPMTLSAGINAGGTGSGDLTLSGVVSGPGMLTKSNQMNLRLSGDNTYTGGTTINAGALLLERGNPNPLGTGPVVVNSGAALHLNGNDNLTNAFTLNAATVVNGNSFSANINGPVRLAATSTVDLKSTGSMTIGGNITGPGGLTLEGSRPLVLAGANTFTGAVTVNGGRLVVTSLNRVNAGTATSTLGAPTTVANGTISLGSIENSAGLMYLGPGETTDRGLTLAGASGTITLDQSGTASGLPTTRGQSGLLRFDGPLRIPGVAGQDNRKTLTLTNSSGDGASPNFGRAELRASIGDSMAGVDGQRATSLTKRGLGTWVLSGSNTYTGATRVEEGTLAFSGASALGSGALDITTGATVRLDFIGTQRLAALTFDGGPAQANGTYGSSLSAATTQDDVHFAGLGTVTVGPVAAPTTTALERTSGTSPINGGLEVTFTATVSGTAPSGEVIFYDGLAAIGSSALASSGRASITTSTLAAGTHSITALFVGNGNHSSSASVALLQVVNETRAATTTTLVSAANPSDFGAGVSVSATVMGKSPAGSVTFFEDATALGTAALVGGTATFVTNSLGVGRHRILATYSGDAANAPSSTPVLFQTVSPPAGNGKLKVFILAGQSNMVGKGSVENGRNPNALGGPSIPGGLGSLRHMLATNPQKYGFLADPANPIAGGAPGWLSPSDVWITYYGGASYELTPNVSLRRGNLDANYGENAADGLIGPEYGFGLVVGSQLADQVLLIKYAHGGRSLAADYRPPSSGGAVGPCYTDLVAAVRKVLGNIAAEFPAAAGKDYELVGFGWHQGFNDRINPAYVAEYETNMVNLIKDLRTEFAAPNMRVSIGTTGMADANADAQARKLIEAQLNVANPARHPELAGTVATVDTRRFDFGRLLGVNDEGYHWYFNGETYFNIGESMGHAMMGLLQTPPSSAKDILTFVFPGQPAATISGNTVSVTVSAQTDLTRLAPTYTLSALASGSPISGTVRDFSAPQSYTVTAQDGSTKLYTVTVTRGEGGDGGAPGGGADAGVVAGADAGVVAGADAGAVGAGLVVGGCGCGGQGSASVWLAALLWVTWRRRGSPPSRAG